MDKLVVEKKAYVTFNAVEENNGKLYMADRENNGLIEYDLNTNIASVKNVFEGSGIKGNYWKAISYEDDIWFLPITSSDKIAIFNTKDNNIDYIDFNIPEYSCEYMPFEDGYVVNEKLYLIPAFYDSILIIDVKTKKINKIDIDIKQYTGTTKRIFSGSCISDEKIYMCPFGHDYLYIYDINLNCYKKKYLKDVNSKYGNILCDNDKIYFLPMYLNYDIIAINRNCYSLEKKSLTFIENGSSYYCSLLYDNKIYFLPYNGKKMLIYSMENNYERIVELADYELYYSRIKKTGKNKYIITSQNRNTPPLLFENGNINILDIKMPEDYFLQELLIAIQGSEKR